MIRTLFLDFGNVLAFFDHRRAIRRLLPNCTVDEATFLQRVYNSDLEHAYESGQMTSEAFLVGVRELTGYSGSDADFRAAFVDIFTPNDSVLALVPKLAERVRIVLASNTNPWHAEHFRSVYADTLQHFFAQAVSYEAGVRKPAAGFYQHAQTFAQGAANECLFVDDIMDNVEGAKAVGWQAVQFAETEALIEALRGFGIDVG